MLLYHRDRAMIISKREFRAIVRELSLKMGVNLPFRSAAIGALQEASESYLVGLFEDANLRTFTKNGEPIPALRQLILRPATPAKVTASSDSARHQGDEATASHPRPTTSTAAH